MIGIEYFMELARIGATTIASAIGSYQSNRKWLELKVDEIEEGIFKTTDKHSIR